MSESTNTSKVAVTKGKLWLHFLSHSCATSLLIALAIHPLCLVEDEGRHARRLRWAYFSLFRLESM